MWGENWQISEFHPHPKTNHGRNNQVLVGAHEPPMCGPQDAEPTLKV